MEDSGRDDGIWDEDVLNKQVSVEQEQLYDQDGEANITEPFDPRDVDIVSKPMVISNMVDQLKYGGIILDPDFQRSPDLWDAVKQSRLIESLIINIPLPTFYFELCGDDKYIVVDGLQRLFAMKQFMALEKTDKNRLRLKGLEYLRDFEGCLFEELPPKIQRRIKSQDVMAYIIRPETPENVKTSIFTRINTGGLMLEPAEIRNSVYRGQAAELLKELAHGEAFVKATRHKIPSSRMLDREFVNRFLAFYLLGVNQYSGNLEAFMNAVMSILKCAEKDVLDQCRIDFTRSMVCARELFGDYAFRRKRTNGTYAALNRPLFEAVSVNLAKLKEEECQILQKKKEQMKAKYEKLFDNTEFVTAISDGTAKIGNVKIRHKMIRDMFRRIIEND